MALTSRCWTWCLVILVLGQRFVMGQSENCTSGIVSSQNWRDEDAQGYLLIVNASSEFGYQVLIPGMRFNCHGFIQRWSALTVLNNYQAVALLGLAHHLYFQLWRPTENGLYKLIDDDHLVFEEPDLRDNVHQLPSESNIGIFRFSRKVGKGMYFQPGDVLGYFAPSHTLNTHISTYPLSVTFRNASMDDAVDASLVVDMYSVSSKRQPCEISSSECENMMTLHSRVVPNIAVHYDEIQPNATITSPPRTSPPPCATTSFTDCRLATTTSVLSSSPLSTSTPVPCTDTHDCLDPDITALVTVLIPVSFAIILIITLGIVAICVTQRKRIARSLAKRSQTYHSRPTHSSTDDIIRFQQLPSRQVPHYHARNGELYALPDRANQQTADIEDTFDGECYASTYQTKGKIHTYHELSETSRRTSLFSRTSTQVSTMSIPSLPPSPELIENPHAAQFPYVEVESQPIASQPVSYAQPVTRRVSAPTFPYVEPVIPRASTEKTGTQRKLFHALDEEGFHVPTAEERGQYQGKNTKDIYSKLARPHFRSHSSRDTIFFEQTDLYWEPPTSAAELYNQLAKRKYREIQRDQVSVRGCIGSGHFGTVHKGVWKVPGGTIDVAVKTLKVDASEGDKVVFLREAAIMGQFLHPNVVKLYGVVTVGEPLMIVLELMSKGDLKEYLRSILKNKPASLPRDLPNRLLNFCQQIAIGMNYLANKAFVHRDLAARNIFLTDDLICKIGDFGMARDLANDSVYHSQGGKIPIKWTAPEALNYRKFSSASDVWSFGMVLYEIWSLGHTPFKKVPTTSQLMSLLDCGHCQPPPPGCPRAIYQLMVQCWNPTAQDRPSFPEICGYLSASDDKLLNWTGQDKMVSGRVAELGAPHSEARNLYPDLQYTYNAF